MSVNINTIMNISMNIQVAMRLSIAVERHCIYVAMVCILVVSMNIANGYGYQ